jgi:putative oxidoreductase
VRHLVLLCRLLLAAIFLFAGAIKASDSSQLAVAIAAFTDLPEGMTALAATLLPFIELAAGILLLLPKLFRIGAAIALALLALFMAAIGWALSEGLIIDCACFGESTPSLAGMWFALGRDAVLAAMAILLLLWPPRSRRGCNPDTVRKTRANG